MNIFMSVVGAGKEVYSTAKYYGITVISVVLLLSFNALFRNYKLLWNQFSFKLLFSLIYGFLASLTISALILIMVISVLGGIVVTGSIFLLRRQISSGLPAGALGIATAIIAPACPACAVGLFGLLGITGALTFLPLQGLEFSIIAIVFLLLSLLYVSKKITTVVCEVRKP